MSIVKYRIKYEEQGIQKQMQIYTYDINGYIKNLLARRRQMKIVDYETM